LIGTALALLVLAGLAILTVRPGLARYFFLHQDSYVVGGLFGLLLVFALAKPPDEIRVPDLKLDRRAVVIGAAVLAALLWAGTYLILDNYPLTRDEHMVVFDMEVFRHGRLAVPVAREWRTFVEALTPTFLLPMPGNVAWVSAYMPGNAMLRTAFATVLDPALMNPLLAAVGAIATFDIARRLFPERRDCQAVALLLYATSAQMLVTAMTTYAMTGHLALNLLWLALYLRGGRAGHAAAIALGFMVIGLHQIIFHPLFALPFVDRLRRDGEWKTALAYLASYAAFGLFWISYQHFVAFSAGVQGASGAGGGAGGFVAERIMPLLTQRDPATLPLMAANLIRFVTWQNLALVPLMLLAWPAIRRDDGIARPLAYGLLLTVAAMAILLPYQGHGWGYRYVHGLLGSCALLGAYGWRDFSERNEVRAFLAIGSVATVALSLPFLIWQTHRFAHPYAAVDQMIGGLDADIVVVETNGTAFAIDEVRNRPDLSNRPLRLASKSLEPRDIALLCNRGTIAFVDVAQMAALGLGVGNDRISPHFQALRQAGARCRLNGHAQFDALPAHGNV
jgi:hypothetical protein